MRFLSWLTFLPIVGLICLTSLTTSAAPTKCEDVLKVDEPVTSQEILERVFFRLQRDYRTPIHEILRAETEGRFLQISDVPFLKYNLHKSDDAIPTFVIGAQPTGLITTEKLGEFFKILKDPEFFDIKVLGVYRCHIEHGPGVARLSQVAPIYLRNEEIIFLKASPQKMRALGGLISTHLHWYHQRLASRLTVH